MTPTRPPFSADSAPHKVRLAEDAWNSRDPQAVSLAYAADCRWRNHAEFVAGRAGITRFLRRKWDRQLDDRLIKARWAITDNCIAVRCAYEWHDDAGSWFRCYGNEHGEFDHNGVMRLRIACINGLPVGESQRLYHWPLGGRPAGHRDRGELGLSTQ